MFRQRSKPGSHERQQDTESSDLEIICEAYDLDEFECDVALAYGAFRGFEIHQTGSMGLPASVTDFGTDRFPIQVFAQGLSVQRQRA